jgi:hypothetical protein
VTGVITFFQTILRWVWEPFTHMVPMMPWRIVLVVLVLVIGVPWVFWRGFPWLLTTLSQGIFHGLAIAADFLVFPESVISTYLRRRKIQPPVIFYGFGNLLSGMVKVSGAIAVQLKRLYSHLSSQPSWQPRRKSLIWTFLLFWLMWGIRPFFGIDSILDRTFGYWNAMESWILTGRWTSATTSPTQFVREYFRLLEQKQYKRAWDLRSPDAKAKLPGGFAGYKKRWQSVEQVKLINQVKLVSKEVHSRVVDVQIEIKRKDQATKIEQLRLKLIWNFESRNWLMEG